MKLVVKKKYIWVSIILVLLITLISYFVFSYLSQKVTRARVANLTSNSVTITWVSNRKDMGYVLLSETNDFQNNIQDLFKHQKYSDARGNGLYYTHYVTIPDLSPEQTYYFRISDGVRVWDLYSTDQSTKWYEISTASSFSFTTKSQSSDIPAFPNDAYGFIQPDKNYALKDSIIFAVADKADESGGLIDNTDSETLATLVNTNGGWMIDKSQFTSSRSDQGYVYNDNQDFMYIYSQIENILMPGSYTVMGTNDAPFETISLNKSNSEKNVVSLKKFFSNPVQAADLSRNLCCALTVSGHSNIYYDFESANDCSSCNSCFPVGRQLNSGTILGVQEFKGIDGKTEGEQRKNCESKKSSAGSVHTSEPDQSSSQKHSSKQFPNKVCNTNLSDSMFNIPTVNRAEFIKLSDQFGAGNYAKDCYNYVVCNAKKDGINPEMELEIWLHESAASNYKLFSTVEDMGIHCYGGNSKYPPYPCNTTPKTDLEMQLGMFNALPHTTCLGSGGFDPVKWAAGFWTGSDCDMAKGTTYITELKLYWSRIATPGSKFPTWIKNPATAQPNLDCNSGQSVPNPPIQDPPVQNPPVDEPPVDQPPATQNRICCAMILDGENQFRLDSERTAKCTNIFPIGGTYSFKDQTKKINYVVQVNLNDFNSCEGKTYNVACQSQSSTAVPEGLRAVSAPAGTNTSTTKCVYIDPHKKVPDNGIIDIPAEANKPNTVLSLIQDTYAADEEFIESIGAGIITFTKDGLYNVRINNYTIKNLPVNSNQKYRLYLDKNKILGYQTADQLISFNKSDIHVTKVDDVTRVDIGAGSNLINLVFQPTVANKPVKASSFLDYANVEGIKIIFITYFDKGQWQKGLRARTDGVPGYIGDDFNIKSNTGYLIISNTELKNKAALVLPGKVSNPVARLKLTKGWNLISANGVKSNSASTIAQTIQSQTKGKVSISQWVNTKAVYDNFQNNKMTIYGNDFTLNSGLSYFVYVDKDVNIVNP